MFRLFKRWRSIIRTENNVLDGIKGAENRMAYKDDLYYTARSL